MVGRITMVTGPAAVLILALISQIMSQSPLAAVPDNPQDVKVKESPSQKNGKIDRGLEEKAGITRSRRYPQNGSRNRREIRQPDWYEGATTLTNAVFAARGSSAIIPCKPSNVSDFVDASYEWNDHLGRSMVDSRFATEETGNLQIDDVQPEDSGRFTCHVQHFVNERSESRTDEFHHHLLEFIMPTFVEEGKFVYDVTGCDGEMTREKERDLLGNLCTATATSACVYHVKVTCHTRSEEVESGDARTSHEMWAQITVKTDADFTPPACGATCMKEATLENLEKNYLTVEALEAEEMVQSSPNMQFSPEKFVKTSNHSCGGGYRPYGSIVCLPCHPGTFSHNDATSCSSCATGFYQNKYGTSDCFRCPRNGTTDDTGADSDILCKDEGVTTLTVKITKEDEQTAGVVAAGIMVPILAIAGGILVKVFILKKKAPTEKLAADDHDDLARLHDTMRQDRLRMGSDYELPVCRSISENPYQAYGSNMKRHPSRSSFTSGDSAPRGFAPPPPPPGRPPRLGPTRGGSSPDIPKPPLPFLNAIDSLKTDRQGAPLPRGATSRPDSAEIPRPPLPFLDCIQSANNNNNEALQQIYSDPRMRRPPSSHYHLPGGAHPVRSKTHAQSGESATLLDDYRTLVSALNGRRASLAPEPEQRIRSAHALSKRVSSSSLRGSRGQKSETSSPHAFLPYKRGDSR